MKRIIKNKIFFIECLFLTLLSFTPLLWFKHKHIVIGIDSGYPVDYIGYFNQRIFTWLGSQNFGIDMSAEVGIVPYNGLPALVQLIGFSLYDVQKVVFVFWFFLILFSMYIFTRYLFPKKEQWVIRIIATIIYAFNLHIYSFWLQGEQPILASYVLLPIFSLFLLRFVRGESTGFKTAVYLNIVFAMFSSGGIRGVPLVAPVLVSSLIIFIYYFLINFRVEKMSYFKRFLSLIIWGGIFFSLLNAYFLIPFLSSFTTQFSNQVAIAGGIDGAIDWAKFISRHTSLTNLFRLHGDNNWYDKPYLWAWAYLTNPFLILVSFLFPIFAYIAPLLAKNKKEKRIILLFIMLSLVGLFLAEGAHFPLGYIYTLMMEYVPGFAAFRSAYYKFIPLVYFSFAILIGYSVFQLLQKFSKNITLISASLVVLLILVYHYPFFSNNNFEFNKPFSTMIEIPSYVKNFAKMQNNLPDRNRTLVVPPPSEFSNIKAYTWGYWGSYPLFPLLTNRNFVVNDVFVYDENENNFINNLYANLRNSDFEAFLTGAEASNIKYILVTHDIAKNFHFSISQEPSVFVNVLKDTNNFKKIWAEGSWELYEIISLNPEKITVSGGVYLNGSGPQAISALMQEGAFPFIEPEVINSLKVPESGSLELYSCVSCILSKVELKPLVTTARIIPTSFLYEMKLNNEKKLLDNSQSDSQKNDAYLGLSLKRVSEIDNLNYIPLENEDAWMKSSGLLKAYWENIQEHYVANVEKIDYVTHKKISGYLTSERDTIKNVIRIKDLDVSKGLGKSLFETVEIQNKIEKTLFKIINEYDWSNTFVYDIKDSKLPISINPSSLAVDLNGEPIFPTEYKLDGNVPELVTVGAKNYDLQIPEGKFNTLTLFFNPSNLYNNPIEKEMYFNGETQRCLVSEILSYSGIKSYVLSTNIDDVNKGRIYFKRTFDTLKTQDYLSHKPSDLNYDLAVDAYTQGTGLYKYVFKGAANDKKVDVYFCASKNKNPAEIFTNVRITEQFTPEIYNFNKNINEENPVPEITYVKVNPTLYRVKVSGAKFPYLLSFSERYSPLWEATISKKIMSNHFKVNGFANGWFVDKKGNYEIEIKFRQQKFVTIGAIVTLVSFLCLLIFSGLQIIKKYHEKN